MNATPPPCRRRIAAIAGVASMAAIWAQSPAAARTMAVSTTAFASVTGVPSPPGDLYATPDPLPPAPAGTLIWAEQISDLRFDPPALAWRILYHSRSRDGQDVAVSGFAIVPTDEIPAGGRSVHAWAHGTVGLGDQCAPSRDVRANLPPYGGPQVERGAVLVATDYEGVGTPGVPTTTVALAEGHAVLDSIRAAASLPNVGALGDVVLAGHSQGGRAALVAAEIAPAYAQELDIVGVVSLAPGVELPALADHLVATPSGIGITLIAAIGLRAGYPDLDLSTVFTPGAVADVPRVETECIDETVARYASSVTTDVVHRDPGLLPELRELLEENSPGHVAPRVPIFIGHGDADQVVPAELTARLAATYCSLGVTVIRKAYPGVGHDDVVDAAVDDAMSFMADRYDRRPADTSC